MAGSIRARRASEWFDGWKRIGFHLSVTSRAWDVVLCRSVEGTPRVNEDDNHSLARRARKKALDWTHVLQMNCTERDRFLGAIDRSRSAAGGFNTSSTRKRVV